MDTTKSYVKMCRYARDLQEGWRPQSGDWWYVSARERFSPILRITYGQEIKWRDCESEYLLPHDIGLYGIVWLPRQDQLFRRLYSQQNQPEADLACQSDIEQRIFEFGKYLGGESNYSAEKLWLLFFMASKYKRVWKDGRWIKNRKVLAYI
ncbi:MAG: hypothetical protein RBU23_01070 [Candidatus Auribacterota bacterium]|jgi:hypothetical protein|nr:hypothetical protein [Candidatus Auribacterota bacterium]